MYRRAFSGASPVKPGSICIQYALNIKWDPASATAPSFNHCTPDELAPIVYFVGGKMHFHKVYVIDGIPADEFYEKNATDIDHFILVKKKPDTKSYFYVRLNCYNRNEKD